MTFKSSSAIFQPKRRINNDEPAFDSLFCRPRLITLRAETKLSRSVLSVAFSATDTLVFCSHANLIPHSVDDACWISPEKQVFGLPQISCLTRRGDELISDFA